ncbi:MAG: chemotaxis protein CheW [Ignavibacteriaceae bacterium]
MLDTVSNLNQFHHSILGRLPGLLIFRINNYEFCVDYQSVREIMQFIDVDSIDKKRVTSEIISPRARYTLVNIHGILEFPNVSFGNDSRLILIDTFGKKFGFIVDKVIELIPTTELFSDNAFDFALPHEGKQRFSGVLKYKNRRIMMLNLEKITREFDKVVEFPRKLKTTERVGVEIKNKLKQVMSIS